MRLLTAGCLNQVKRISEKYDEILYGPALEMLVKEMHQAIKDLMRSAECAALLKDTHVPSHETGDRGHTLIRIIM